MIRANKAIKSHERGRIDGAGSWKRNVGLGVVASASPVGPATALIKVTAQNIGADPQIDKDARGNERLVQLLRTSFGYSGYQSGVIDDSLVMPRRKETNVIVF